MLSLLSLTMLSSLLSFLVTFLLYFARSFGCVFRVHRIRLRSLEHISFMSRKWQVSLSAVKVGFTLHCPRRADPYWAVIFVDDLEYKDSKCHFSLKRGEAKLWIFPVLLRYTAGPWIAAMLDGFVVHVSHSSASPWWINAIRNNLLSTALNGETIRLDHSSTKIYLNALNFKPTRDQNGDEDEDEEAIEEESDTASFQGAEDREKDLNEELRVRSYLSQWHILSPWYSRVYTFGDLQAEVRRSWADEKGSFVMIAKECRWIKVPDFERMEGYRKASTLWQVLHALWFSPVHVWEFYKDPLSSIDLYAPRTDITFGDFRLHDAQLLHHAALRLQQEYCKLETRHPGVVGEFAWNAFLHGVLSAFQD